MNRMSKRIGIMHYTAPPTMGGVEAVIAAHTEILIQEGFQVTIIAGRQETPEGTQLPPYDVILIPEMDSKFEAFEDLNRALDAGNLPKEAFDEAVERMVHHLQPVVSQFDCIIAHNILTKHFNLPLTAAIYQLLDTGNIKKLINWCHDLTWGSPNSGHKVHAGYPWDFLRTYRNDISYVTGSKNRREQLVEQFRRTTADNTHLSDKRIDADDVHVIYNGINIELLMGLSPETTQIATQIGLFDSDLNIIMPVRISQAKNIEYTIKLIDILHQAEPHLHIKMVVTGPPDPHNPEDVQRYRALVAQTQSLGLTEIVHFIYSLPDEYGKNKQISLRAVGELYRLSDILLMPSHREGFGIPIIEAALMGLFIIASEKVPAVTEIAKDQAKIFVLHEDEERNHQERINLAKEILSWHRTNTIHILRADVRKRFSWVNIYQRDIKPLLG